MFHPCNLEQKTCDLVESNDESVRWTKITFPIPCFFGFPSVAFWSSLFITSWECCFENVQQKLQWDSGERWSEFELGDTDKIKWNDTSSFWGSTNIQWTWREILTFFEFQHVNPPLTVPRRLLFWGFSSVFFSIFRVGSLISAGQVYQIRRPGVHLELTIPLCLQPVKRPQVAPQPSQAYRICRWTLNFPKVEPFSPNIPGMPKILYSLRKPAKKVEKIHHFVEMFSFFTGRFQVLRPQNCIFSMSLVSWSLLGSTKTNSGLGLKDFLLE